MSTPADQLAGATSPPVARLTIGGELAVVWRDRTGRHRSEHVALCPTGYATERIARRRWSTRQLTAAGWTPGGRWTQDVQRADVRAVTRS